MENVLPYRKEEILAGQKLFDPMKSAFILVLS